MTKSSSQAFPDDSTFEDICDTAAMVRSHAVSIQEAAFRRDSIFIRIHRLEFIREANLLVGLIRDLAPLEGEKVRAA
jgi:hypothetical protein